MHVCGVGTNRLLISNWEINQINCTKLTDDVQLHFWFELDNALELITHASDIM